MGYMGNNIPNLYRDEAKPILEFRRLYALEKAHGTSANVKRAARGHVTLSSGGASATTFKALFNVDKLEEAFRQMGSELNIEIHGEAYGGSEQHMSSTYGPKLCFAAFDVKINGLWLAVEKAQEIVVDKFGLEFVPWELVPSTMEALDAERDRDSILAIRRGMGPGKKREGVVLRPPFEVRLNNDQRLIAKHKRPEFHERQNQPKPDDPVRRQALAEANAIAEEWVTRERLTHVLDHAKEAGAPFVSKRDIPKLIAAMRDDVYREAKGEIIESKEAETAIGRMTATLFLERIGA